MRAVGLNICGESLAEEWRDIVGYEGLYQVSNLGRIRGLNRIVIRRNGWAQNIPETIRAPKKSQKGYLSIQLHNLGHKRNYKIHRLVAKMFIPNPECKDQVDHIDGCKSNNIVTNLRWCTNKENCNFGNFERLIEKVWEGQTGHLHPSAKSIIGTNKQGHTIKYDCMQEAKRDGFDPVLISKCCNNYPHYITHKGYMWRHA